MSQHRIELFSLSTHVVTQTANDISRLLLTTCAHEAGHAAATKMHIHIVEQAYAIISTHLLIDCSINNFLSRYLHCDSAYHSANVDPSSLRFQRNLITNAFPNQR